jgi:hypothetical protein
MKPHPEMIEGPEAWTRFRDAMQSIVRVPKSALPLSPFGQRKKTKKPVTKKELIGCPRPAFLSYRFFLS